MMQIALASVQYLILFACITLWVVRLVRKRTGAEFLSSRDHEISPLGIIDVFITVLIWFVLQLAALLVAPLVFGIDISEPKKLLPQETLRLNGCNMLFQLAATFVAIAYYLNRHQSVGWLGRREFFLPDVVIGITASVMLIPLVMLIQFALVQWIDYTHPTIDSLREGFSGGAAVWAWLSAVVIAPITEEFFFRGVIQGGLQRFFDVEESMDQRISGGHVPSLRSVTEIGIRFWAPVVIASFLFAAVHYSQGPAPIPLFFFALGLGFTFRKTGSWVSCVILHFVLNALSMGMLTLQILFPDAFKLPEAATACRSHFFF